jgi:ABC-type branched-subunit amino acid transport system substrate-binding protein
VQPIAAEAGVPFMGPFTGAAFLRDPSLGNVINVRGSYDQETEAWIERLTTDLGVSRIAILYQDDTFGRAGLSGVSKAMERRGMKLVAEGTYERNTTAVKMALLEIRKADPEAIVMVGAYKPCAEFIKLAHRLKLNPVFVNISFVGAQRPRQGTRPGRERSGGDAGRAIPRGREHPARGLVPESAQGNEYGRADRFRVARGVHGRPIGVEALGR